DRHELPAPATSLRPFITWLEAQDRSVARDAWREYLKGIDTPTLIAPASGDARRQAHSDESLPAELNRALEALARRCGVTLATVLQGAWAVLLARLLNRTDLCFGNVGSGRHAPVPGIERMLGLLITTTPLRALLVPDEAVAEWLARLQQEQARLLEHQHLPLTEMHKLVGMPALFDTLFSSENYPVDALPVAASADELPLTQVGGHNSNHYPLSLAAIPGDGLTLRLRYNAVVFAAEAVERLSARLVR